MQSRLNKLVSVGTCESHIKCKVFVHNSSQIFLFLEPIFIFSNLFKKSKLKLERDLQNRQKEGTEKSEVTIVNRNKLIIFFLYKLGIAKTDFINIIHNHFHQIASQLEFNTDNRSWSNCRIHLLKVRRSILGSDFKTKLKKESLKLKET